MRLKNDREFENSQRKLTELLKRIDAKERAQSLSQAHALSLESMRFMAKRLRTEVEEYERAHQTS
jgi:hypothetical protein